MNKPEKFRANLLDLSISREFEEAKEEWEYVRVEYNKDREECLCSQKNITDIVVIQNKRTQAETRIGKNCAENHLGIWTSSNVFSRLRRVHRAQTINRAPAKNPANDVHEANLKFFKDEGAISEWEYSFSLDTYRLRSMSSKQRFWSDKIGRQIKSYFSDKDNRIRFSNHKRSL